jgi:hypothetical protein
MTSPTWACTWLDWKPTNNPEPDQMYGIGGVYQEAECGATARNVIDPATGDVDGWLCEAGHRHLHYGSRRQRIEESTNAMKGSV